MWNRVTLSICLLLIAFACTREELPAPVGVHTIEGKNSLCVYPEPVDTAVRHAHYFEPQDPNIQDTTIAFKGSDRWVGSITSITTVEKRILQSTAVWRGEEILKGSWDVLGFAIASNQTPGCYTLSTNKDAWM